MTEHHRWKPVVVTVSDPESGAVLERRTVANDYCLITAGNRYVKNLQIMGRTHVIAIAVFKSQTAEDAAHEIAGEPPK